MTDETERAPDYPPVDIRIVIPLDGRGVPYVTDESTCADWLIRSALEHLLARMEAEEEAGDIQVTTNQEDDEA